MNLATQRGFTLIEMSVVLFIVAIVVGMSMQAGISVISAQRQNATQLKMKTIDAALMQFRVANDRLPCPGNLTLAPGSTDYGYEAGADASSTIGIGTGACTGTGMLPVANFTGSGVTNTGATAAEGALPAITLGLSPDFMLDGWGNKIRYAVDISYTAKGVFTTSSVGCTASAAITVNDQNGTARTSGAVYALVSHGANGHGAYTTSGSTYNAGSSSAGELTNCHCTSAGTYNGSYGPTYVQKLPQYDSGEANVSAYYFDDLVSFKERWQMRADWDKVAGCAQYFYVTDSGNNRVQVFNMSGSYLSQFGSGGTGNGQLSDPAGVAVDSSGNIWVEDFWNNRFEKFSSSGSYVSQFPTAVAFNGNNYMQEIAIDHSGNIWALDNRNNRVVEFNSSGSYLSQLGCASGSCSSGSGNGNLSMPLGITIDSSGNVWVSDSENSRIEEFSNSGTYLGQITSSNLDTPAALAIDKSGNFWVDDLNDHMLDKFSSNGTYLGTFGNGFGSGAGQEGAVSGIAVDSSNNVWLNDYSNNRVQEFSNSGSYLGVFGSYGTGNGQFNNSYAYPGGIAIGNR